MASRILEVDLLRAVQQFFLFRNEHAKHRYEVPLDFSLYGAGMGGESIDIVVDDGRTLTVCEGKTALTNDLMGQALRVQDATHDCVLRPLADYVWIACRPLWKPGREARERLHLLNSRQIGVLFVNDGGDVEVHREAGRQFDAYTDPIRNALVDEQGNSSPGSAGVFRAKKDGWEPVREILRAFGKDGLDLSQLKLEDTISHWPRSKFQEFARKAASGAVPGVEARDRAGQKRRYRMRLR